MQLELLLSGRDSFGDFRQIACFQTVDCKGPKIWASLVGHPLPPFSLWVKVRFLGVHGNSNISNTSSESSARQRPDFQAGKGANKGPVICIFFTRASSEKLHEQRKQKPKGESRGKKWREKNAKVVIMV